MSMVRIVDSALVDIGLGLCSGCAEAMAMATAGLRGGLLDVVTRGHGSSAQMMLTGVGEESGLRICGILGMVAWDL